MSKKLGISAVFLGWSLGALGLLLVPGCGSDAATSPGGAGASAAGAGASGTPSGGSSPTAGAGNPQAGNAGQSPVAGGGGTNQAGAGGSSAGSANGGASGAGMSGAAGAAPAGGSSGCGSPPTEAQRKAPAFPASTIANPAGVLFRFMNNCSEPIWIRSPVDPGKSVGIPGEVVQLASKATKDFDITGVGIHGRVEAYRGAAPGSAGSYQAQFTEMNATKDQALNVNLSHVDWVGLPVEVKGNASGKDCGVTACYQPLAHLLDGCPTQLLDTKENKCHAPNWYCGAHAAEPFCQALMASATNTVNTDPDCSAGKGITFTPNDVFGCAGAFFSGQGVKNGNVCCAKVNRNYPGNASKQTSNDRCSFYKSEPYNVYANWAQKQCPYIYTFAYDDVAEQSGYFVCSKGTEMDVTYCPGDP